MKFWRGVNGKQEATIPEAIRRKLIKPILGLFLTAAFIGLIRPTPQVQHIHNRQVPPAHTKAVSVEKNEPTVKEAVKVVAPAPPAPVPQAENPPAAPVAVVTVLQGKDAWLSASNISASNYGYVDYIVSHESSWNPDATEPNSGAHGLPQALPYSKTGCGWSDAVCQLNWANAYAVSRYGSWASAYSYWAANHNW
jgi:hypothetical protein